MHACWRGVHGAEQCITTARRPKRNERQLRIIVQNVDAKTSVDGGNYTITVRTQSDSLVETYDRLDQTIAKVTGRRMPEPVSVSAESLPQEVRDALAVWLIGTKAEVRP